MVMAFGIDEAIEYLESFDVTPTKERIEEVLEKWISNLYSHIGVAAHKHLLACGVVDETGMTWEEQDAQCLRQIHDYQEALTELRSKKE